MPKDRVAGPRLTIKDKLDASTTFEKLEIARREKLPDLGDGTSTAEANIKIRDALFRADNQTKSRWETLSLAPSADDFQTAVDKQHEKNKNLSHKAVAELIRRNFTNPATGKPYSARHITRMTKLTKR